MGFSSIIGASSVIRPGVCTSTTRPSSPYDGQVIYETDTQQTLVYNGSGWVMLTDANQPPGLQLIKTQTIGTAVSSVTVSDVFSSDFSNYRIVIDNVGASQNNAGFKFVLNGLTSGVYGVLFYDLYTGAATGYDRQNNGSVMNVGFTSTVGGVNTVFDVLGPNLAQRTHVSGQWSQDNYFGWFSYIASNTTQYTGFVLSSGTGTTTGGTVRVYGYRNS